MLALIKTQFKKTKLTGKPIEHEGALVALRDVTMALDRAIEHAEERSHSRSISPINTFASID